MELSLKNRIGQLFMIGFYGEDLPGEVESFIQENNIGFVILFSRNIKTASQAAALTNHIHNLGKISPAIFTDQEGGLVVRFGEMAATMISHMGLAATGEPQNARLAGRVIAQEMGAVGIDGVLAPVLDVNCEEDNPVIGSRAFSDVPDTVTSFAKEFVAGLNEGGTAACGKHYPGHGCTSKDSHLDIPETPVSLEYFLHYCCQPFLVLAGSGIDSLMSAHVLFPLVSDKIATFSPYLVQELLREKAGYPGVIFSDCLEMKAVKDNFSAEEIVSSVVSAGIDVLSVSHHLDFQKELFDLLLFKVKKGIIAEERIDESLARVLKLKEKWGLLDKGKAVSPQQAEQRLRSSMDLERKIARQSVTLLRDRQGILPIKKEKKCLVLEWEKGEASLLAEIGRKYLPHSVFQVLRVGEPIPRDLPGKLTDYPYIIACPYSLNREREILQAEALKQILRVRADVIVAALGNPYDIRQVSNLDTYLVTYGSRQVQLEALFQVITGEIRARGRLPVEIKGIFPRGYGII